MKRICTICARGGSKGVPGKNMRLLAGKPLLAHSIEQARACGLFDVVAVSSDDAAILAAATAYGADLAITRPHELATDTAAKLPVIRHAVETAEARCGLRFDTMVDLDATSPLRSVEDIVNAVRLLEEEGAGNVITGMPARRSPYFNLVERDAAGRVGLAKTLATPVFRRQDAPACFDMNASIYAWRRAVLFEAPGLFNADTRLYEMPEERSIDIDSEVDFLLVELLINRRHAQGQA
ncbi:acylneuraminate cytidylyltransferase family protein [Massilia glaciei]|uniref:Acylneuraminate cytidylyltransferase family protein n=1 Tax=Massilia glaciei TaxID=1524097 RepID=A0A2U2HN99_9BURK|nr:acylneuraminate cytidylyltransferase family protein [Massilia glaciei]PWF48932.1 acylneuraminate cytidylyltransferase family protein [Massilia glaciei]